jgi:hypothetical protein
MPGLWRTVKDLKSLVQFIGFSISFWPPQENPWHAAGGFKLTHHYHWLDAHCADSKLLALGCQTAMLEDNVGRF